MSELAILVPVLGRPHRVKPLLNSIRKATPDALVLFLLSSGDQDEFEAVLRSDADFVAVPGGYAAKINAGVQMTQAPLLFFGADDLEFHPGWFERAKAKMTDGIQVVGTNDLCNRRTLAGTHATHFLVAREYAEQPTVDGPGPLCEEYHHWCVDDEFFGTAASRGVLAVAPDAVVEHLHPDVGKAPWDDTYTEGVRLNRADRRLRARRRLLWT